MNGRNSGIMKKEFLYKTPFIPFLTDLMRAETLFRDYNQPFQGKTPISSISFNFYLQSYLFCFIFEKDARQSTVTLKGSTFVVNTSGLFLEDTFDDVRNQIIDQLNRLKISDK